MSVSSELITDIDEIINYGDQIRIKYFNQVITGEYNDDITLTQSGTDFWCSGLIMPIDNKFGSYDSLLLQQGKITIDDKKIYVRGTVQTSGLAPIKIGTNGSPPVREYELLNDTQWELEGTSIYKKMYVRYLTNGSFYGE